MRHRRTSRSLMIAAAALLFLAACGPRPAPPPAAPPPLATPTPAPATTAPVAPPPTAEGFTSPLPTPTSAAFTSPLPTPTPPSPSPTRAPSDTPTSAPTPTLEPAAQVIVAWHTAWGAKDIDAFMALVADDAVLDRGPAGVITGKEALRPVVVAEMEEGLKARVGRFKVEGDKVFYHYEVFAGGSKVDEGDAVAIVENGKIVSDLPATAAPPTATPAAISAEALIGTWQPISKGRDAMHLQLGADGACRQASSLDGLATQPEVECTYALEGNYLLLTAVKLHGVPPCPSPTGRYEVRPLADNRLQLVAAGDRCAPRRNSTAGEYQRAP